MARTSKSQNASTRKSSRDTKEKSGLVKRKRNTTKTVRRLVSKRSIIRGVKSAWVFFVQEHRDEILLKNPDMQFGDVCKNLSPIWAGLDVTERKKYDEMHTKDKERYTLQKERLTPDQKFTLKQIKTKKRRSRKDKRPKQALSPYMFFVTQNRSKIVESNAEMRFEDVGRELGKRWRSMSTDEKAPYIELYKQDKIRYKADMEKLSN